MSTPQWGGHIIFAFSAVRDFVEIFDPQGI